MTRCMARCTSPHVKARGGGMDVRDTRPDLAKDLIQAYPELNGQKPDIRTVNDELERTRDQLEQQIDILQKEKMQTERQLALIRAYGTANPDEAFVQLIEDGADVSLEAFLRLLGRQLDGDERPSKAPYQNARPNFDVVACLLARSYEGVYTRRPRV